MKGLLRRTDLAPCVTYAAAAVVASRYGGLSEQASVFWVGIVGFIAGTHLVGRLLASRLIRWWWGCAATV